MRIALLLLALVLQAPAMAAVAPEKIGVATLGEPTGDWFLNRSEHGAYLFDAASGNMLGMLPLTMNTPAVVVDHARGEAYAAESHFSRTYRGDRQDVLAIYDTKTLEPVAEVDIPDKAAALSVSEHLAMSGDRRFVFVYNMTPAQSVSVVNVESRTFVGELSTPGCGMLMPVEQRSFLSVCGDGTVQLIVLDEQGRETERKRSKAFFSVHDDAVFDRTTRTRDGWLLITHAGRAFNVSAKGSTISVGQPWWLSSEEDRAAQWRPGGQELIASHLGTNLVLVLMHQGGVDTHHTPGSEIWIFDAARGKRVFRWRLEDEATHILALQTEKPRFILATENGGLDVYDGFTQRHERSIEEFGRSVWLLQGF